MVGNIQKKLEQQIIDLKSKLKKLSKEYFLIHEHSKKVHITNIYKLKKDHNNLVLAEKKLESISTSLSEGKLNLKNPPNNDDKDLSQMDKLLKDSLKNIKLISNIVEKKIKQENINNNFYSKNMSEYRKNLDNLRIAYTSIKRIDYSLGLSPKDWKSIEKIR